MGNSSSTMQPPKREQDKSNTSGETSFFDTPVKQDRTHARQENAVINTQTPSRVASSSWSSWFYGRNTSGYLKVLFCGKNAFSSAFIYTAQELKYNRNIIVKECEVSDIPMEIIDAHVVVPLMSQIDKSLLEKAPYLNVIHQFGVSLEGVDVDAATELGISVASIPSDEVGNAQSTAEHAIFLCLSVLRQVNVHKEMIQIGVLGSPTGCTIMDASIMIYGFGNLGKQITQRLFAFQPKRIVAIKKLPWVGAVPVRIEEIGLIKDVARLSKGIDIVFICCPQTEDNLGMFNKQFLKNLNRGAILINVARGGLLNYEDVYVALESGQLAGVGIDVYKIEPFPPNDAFLRHKKVVVTPHIAGATEMSYRAMAKTVAGNVERLMKDEELRGVVNF